MKIGNEGRFDRVVRGIIGVLVILSAAPVNPGKWAVEMVGLYLIVTAVTGWCPLYAMVHLDTRHEPR